MCQATPWEQYMLQALIKVTSGFVCFFEGFGPSVGPWMTCFEPSWLRWLILRTISLFHILLVKDETSTLYGMFGERLRTANY